MSTTLARPQIEGFAGDVEQFAADHGITEIIFAMHDFARQLYPMAGRIRLKLGEDYEDSSWRHVDIHIEELPISPTEAYEINRRWIPEVGAVCPAEHAWLFTHQLSFAE